MRDEKSFAAISNREEGLKRHLTPGQMSMIAIGGAIGTGLFMGSGYAISFAGPGVLISYGIGAVIALLLMGCLAEMTIAHPTSGSFGAYAEFYLSPLAGFLVRYSYWAAIVLAIGTEVTAIAMYMKYWFADVPGWVWIISFSALLILSNAISVKAFGHFEYIFSAVKIAAILAFILLGVWLVFGGSNTEYGFHHYVDHGGFLPKGWSGVWIALIIAIFSYLSIETIAVAAGEAEEPTKAVKHAFRVTMARLLFFYIITLALILAMTPWDVAAQGTESPFVVVMNKLGIPAATGTINFVILVAALSAMNSQLYAATRIMFSLSRAGYAPNKLGNLNKRGIPMNALLISCAGTAVATSIYVMFPEQSFMLMMSIAIFGAMFTWMMIFLTHLSFRRYQVKNGHKLEFKMWGYPWGTLIGAGLTFAILVTTAFVPRFNMTLVFGLPFLIILTVCYRVFLRTRVVSGENSAVDTESVPNVTQ
ncbi:amino acid permease [Pseudomonas monteilii]|uniref:amino acid permease n=1 Tax=Pseudomonas monteilii TaxID=76759 RepID=UPI001E628673|nr:amino acid permease [Pseudomonas monteilii]MCE1020677.1 amino acid permease [Pseudomonas monteilii]MCE1038206.1 amino acid permease [Pseudomonas monteilii]MCE1089771.1 amino acid permease [Pseudomonas monteilii]